MTETRLPEVTGTFFRAYEAAYPHKPTWGPKEAKLLKLAIKSFEERGLGLDKLKEAIEGYFVTADKFAIENRHSFAVFALNPDKYLHKTVDGNAHALEMIRKTKEMFMEKEVVRDFTMDGLVKAMSELYPPTKEGCLAWTKGQKFLQNTLELTAGSRTHNNWVRAGKAARIYFGDDLVRLSYKETQDDKELYKEMIKKQAKDFLTKEIKDDRKEEHDKLDENQEPRDGEDRQGFAGVHREDEAQAD